MPSTFFGLNIAVSGMNTYYAGLNTTAHNIANVDTKGYSKQSVKQEAKNPISLKTSYGMMGAGVNAKEIISSRDEYYDYKYRESNSTYGYYDSLDHYMLNIEENMYAADAESGGISNSLDAFFKSLTSLTTDAADTTIRAQIVGNGDAMMSFVQELANSLQTTQKELNIEIESTVKQINAYAQQLASLTKQINTLEVYGGRANDLRDQRANILDELSALVDIDVVEQPPADGNGTEQFLVFIGDGTLVDTYVYNTISIETRTTKDNQTDCEGLYDLRWSNGQDFNIRNTVLGGELQALFELRDGNNAENFKTTFTGYEEANDRFDGRSTLTMVTDATSSENASALAKLNIPESDGVISIYNFDFQYESFEVSVAADGTYTYTFVLKEDLTRGEKSHLDVAMSKGKTDATVGDAVDFRGVPYYLSQLTEFVRTFSANFNQVQNQGYDLYGEQGVDVFVASLIASGEEFDMTEFLYNKEEDFYYLNGCKVMNSTKRADYASAGYTFEAIAGEDGYYNMQDETGKKMEKVYIPADDTSIFTFTSNTVSGEKTSYYNMTALDAVVARDVLNDGKKIAAASAENSGVAEGGNLDRMTMLREDTTMFKQGTAGAFLSVMTATVGVDTAKVDDNASNSKNILDAVGNRRMSKTGVDEDEEGQNLIELQNLLNYQYQVISVMNECLDRLITATGV